MTVSDILIPLLFLTAFGCMAFILTNKGKNNHRLRAQAAAEKYFTYVQEGSAVVDHNKSRNHLYTLTGVLTNRQSFTIKAYYQKSVRSRVVQSDNVYKTYHAHTSFTAPCRGFKGMILPKIPADISFEQILKGMQLLGFDIDHQVMNKVTSTEKWSKYFDVFAETVTVAQDYMKRIEDDYIKYASQYTQFDQPRVLITRESLSIYIPWCAEKAEDMINLAETGAMLVDNLEKPLE